MSYVTTPSSPVSLDAGFTEGLHGTETAFHRGSILSEQPFAVNLEPGDTETQLDFVTKKFRDAASGVALAVTLAGEGSRLAIVHPGWLGDGEHPLSKYQVTELAKRLPDTQFAYVNAPGVRGSDKLPGRVMREMKRGGSYIPYGEILNGVLEKLIKDSDITDGVGWSTGARALIGMLGAKEESQVFGNLAAIDGPGSRDMGGIFGIKDAFIVNEGAKAKLYNEANADPETIRLKQAGGGILGAVKLFGGMALRGALLQEVLGLPKVMAKSGLQGDLIEATDHLGTGQKLAIVFSSPELSTLNDPQAVKKIMQLVSSQTSAELTQMVLERQSHGFMDAHTPYMTQLIADILKLRHGG